jgi:hypothetical protein
LTRTASDEVVARRVKRRHIYFWILVALGVVTVKEEIFSVL